MMPVLVKGYGSPALVLLAYDWAAAGQRSDFRGFAIERTPGFGGEERSRLSYRQGSEDADPIRTFYCWDASIDPSDRGACFQYRVVPVIGQNDTLQMLDQEAGHVQVQVP